MALEEVLLGARWVVALLLLAAGAAKLGSVRRTETREAIRSYGALPHAVHRPAAAALPYTELLVAVLLITGVVIDVVATVCAVLLGAFAAVMAWHVSRGASFDCGCGSGHQISWVLVFRNVFLCFLAAGIVLGPSAAMSIWPGPGQTVPAIPLSASLPIPLTVVLLALATRLLEGWDLRNLMRARARHGMA